VAVAAAVAAAFPPPSAHGGVEESAFLTRAVSLAPPGRPGPARRRAERRAPRVSVSRSVSDEPRSRKVRASALRVVRLLRPRTQALPRPSTSRRFPDEASTGAAPSRHHQHHHHRHHTIRSVDRRGSWTGPVERESRSPEGPQALPLSCSFRASTPRPSSRGIFVVRTRPAAPPA
jgi:hypothetical protein